MFITSSRHEFKISKENSVTDMLLLIRMGTTVAFSYKTL